MSAGIYISTMNLSLYSWMHFIMYYHSSFIEEKVFNNIEAIHDKTEANPRTWLNMAHYLL